MGTRRRAAYHARSAARTPRRQALGRGSRFERRARLPIVGKCGAFRSAHIHPPTGGRGDGQPAAGDGTVRRQCEIPPRQQGPQRSFREVSGAALRLHYGDSNKGRYCLTTPPATNPRSVLCAACGTSARRGACVSSLTAERHPGRSRGQIRSLRCRWASNYPRRVSRLLPSCAMASACVYWRTVWERNSGELLPSTITARRMPLLPMSCYTTG